MPPRIISVFPVAYPKHFVGQALRRAFLYGVDHQTGESDEHRREWVEARIPELAEVFAMEDCAYAVIKGGSP